MAIHTYEIDATELLEDEVVNLLKDSRDDWQVRLYTNEFGDVEQFRILANDAKTKPIIMVGIMEADIDPTDSYHDVVREAPKLSVWVGHSNARKGAVRQKRECVNVARKVIKALHGKVINFTAGASQQTFPLVLGWNIEFSAKDLCVIEVSFEFTYLDISLTTDVEV